MIRIVPGPGCVLERRERLQASDLGPGGSSEELTALSFSDERIYLSGKIFGNHNVSTPYGHSPLTI
jgi:hypothetical protein